MERDDRADASRPLEGNPDVSLGVIPLHSTNLLTVLDADGTIRYESPSIERVYGFEQAELVGDQVATYFHPEDRDRVLAAFERVVASDAETVEAVEYRHERADGSYTWVESVTSGNRTPAGHYVVNTRDVSARRERERRLEAANERLEAFVGVLSHDLRNPLNVAQAHLALAAESVDSEHHAPIGAAHERIEALVRDLLARARGEVKGSPTEPVDLACVVEDCWALVPTADATLENDVDGRVLADRSRLRQLVENLVRNAVEHGTTGGRRESEDAVERAGGRDGTDVTVTVGGLDTGFYVADDGVGIPETDREQVSDAGHSAVGDRVGLGLGIIAEVARAHDWDVRVTESDAGGARFEFSNVETP